MNIKTVIKIMQRSNSSKFYRGLGLRTHHNDIITISRLLTYRCKLQRHNRWMTILKI